MRLRHDNWHAAVDAVRDRLSFTRNVGADRVAQVLLHIVQRNAVNAWEAIEHQRDPSPRQFIAREILQKALRIAQRRNFRRCDDQHIVCSLEQGFGDFIEE